MAAANRDLLLGQVSDGCGKLDLDDTEADADGSVRILDVVDGEPGDRRGPPAVSSCGTESRTRATLQDPVG